jgi:uncharacterized protein YegP (UPF0339 family)
MIEIYNRIYYFRSFHHRIIKDFLKLNIEHALFLKSKSSKGKYFFRLLINDKQLAISRKYATQLMIEKGIIEISKYVTKSEILDFSNNDFIFD